MNICSTDRHSTGDDLTIGSYLPDYPFFHNDWSLNLIHSKWKLKSTSEKQLATSASFDPFKL
jgi:hypothetical protein